MSIAGQTGGQTKHSEFGVENIQKMKPLSLVVKNRACLTVETSLDKINHLVPLLNQEA